MIIVKSIKNQAKYIKKHIITIMEKFDLTNSKEFNQLVNTFLTSSPLLSLAKYVVDKTVDKSKRWETQRELAIQLLKEGKDKGIDEMEIIIDNKGGAGVDIPIDGVNINAHVGTDEKMHIKAKYK